jgi:predicted DCC family thiol-disulfide oxidoreductase YuxK
MKPRSTPAAGASDGGGHHLVLYDGVCGLCNRVNSFVLRHDRRSLFDFASLQSAVGRSFLRRFDRHPDTVDTFYVVANYRSDTPALASRSDAALFVATRIGAPWSWLGVFGVVPRAWLDRGYDAIARNRYRLFGQSEMCLMPAAEYTKRFIDV